MSMSIEYSIYCKNKLLENNTHLIIEYGSAPSPFGTCFLAVSEQNICKLAFFDSAIDENNLRKELAEEWQEAKLVENQIKIEAMIEQIFTIDFNPPSSVFKLLLKGTPFQIKVWHALLSILPGKLMTYQDVANLIGQPTAVRAAASAIAKNNIAYLIPCHRVIRKNGDIGQYRWHAHRKQAIIAVEEQLSSLW